MSTSGYPQALCWNGLFFSAIALVIFRLKALESADVCRHSSRTPRHLNLHFMHVVICLGYALCLPRVALAGVGSSHREDEDDVLYAASSVRCNRGIPCAVDDLLRLHGVLG